jgi:hypothetical protein
MKLGQFKTIEEPDQPACWLHRNVRVKGYVGEVELPTDQFIMRPIEHIFQEACTTVRGVLPDGRDPMKPVVWPKGPGMLDEVDLGDELCARIVEVEEIDDYGSLLFKFRYWGVPEK